MAKELTPLDISDQPDLLRLAQEVQATRQPRLLQRDGEELAILIPVTHARRPSSLAASRARAAAAVARSKAGIRASAGSWKDLDVEAFKTYVRERRTMPGRPPVRL